MYFEYICKFNAIRNFNKITVNVFQYGKLQKNNYKIPIENIYNNKYLVKLRSWSSAFGEKNTRRFSCQSFTS